jgi:hypothetical protein
MQWKREVIEIQAQIADLPKNVPYHGGHRRLKNPLFSQLAQASAKLNRWTDKLRDSELDIYMRNGAWRRFDIDEAIKTSDR